MSVNFEREASRLVISAPNRLLRLLTLLRISGNYPQKSAPGHSFETFEDLALSGRRGRATTYVKNKARPD
jgi:hypothetical protein